MKILDPYSLMPPWVHKAIMPDDNLPVAIERLEDDGAKVFIFDGERLNDGDKFYNDISCKLGFPDYFGRNLNALFDCLKDPDFIPDAPCLFIISKGALFLSKEDSSAVSGVLNVFAHAGKVWSKPRGQPWSAPAIPLNTVVQLSVDQNRGPYARLDRVDCGPSGP